MKIMLTDMNLKLKFQKQVPVMREIAQQQVLVIQRLNAYGSLTHWLRYTR